MTLLTLTASVPGMRPTCHTKDECYATSSQMAICFVALYLMALRTGGIKPCVSSYVADQFDDADEVEKSHKSSFNWFYFSINVGTSITSSVLVYIQVNVGWGWGFGVPAVAMAIAIASSFRALIYLHLKVLFSILEFNFLTLKISFPFFFV
ncbi:protein nrt1/ ptr family 8.2 [Phtheirospermum japonicum]|uniref:Protein nrt1/ ptr family 8.2 n=1 Tax=Phtheirospermum japonicum TaxID=374723 RepID=A0A830B898_9LAMI|nr:protein nrt1/ ptr family 8.2 [Phtheirospermum japonicum]